MTLSNLSDDLDKTLYTMLKPNLDSALSPETVEVSFAVPNKDFAGAVTGKVIGLYLYDVREDLELRASENLKFRTQPTAGATTTNLRRPPVNVIYSYLITAWSPAGAYADSDEHYLLNKAIDILIGFREIPDALLQGALASMEPKPRLMALTPGHLGSLGELWSAMGNHPKPLANLSVTLAREQPDMNAMLVTSTNYQVAQKP